MRWTALTMCWLLVGMGVTPGLAQAADEAQKKLQGAWLGTKAEQDGKSATSLVGHRLTFTGNHFQIRSKNGNGLFEGTFRTDPSAKPAAIDFAHTGGALKGKQWKGIYRMDGETLAICDNAPNVKKGRPATFEAKQGSGYVCLTFKRAKA